MVRRRTSTRSTRKTKTSRRTLSKAKKYVTKAKMLAMKNKYKLAGGAAGLAGTYALHKYLASPYAGSGASRYSLGQAALVGAYSGAKKRAKSFGGRTKARMNALLKRTKSQ